MYYKPDFNKKVWLVSDYHGFHKNLTYGVSNWEDKSQCRMFTNEEDMTRYVASETNKKVASDDILIHLGDWAFGGQQNIKRFREMINCETIITHLGNHDHHIPKYKNLFERVLMYNEFRYKKILFTMFHYALGVWNEIGNGAVNLCGHSHGSYQRFIGRQMDVGIDANNYQPLLLDDIYERMKNVPIETVDHHDSSTSYH